MTIIPFSGSSFKNRTWLSQAAIILGTILCAVLLVHLGSLQPLYLVAVLYIAIFLTIAWMRPHWALLAIFAASPFQTDVSNGGFAKFSFAEVNLALTFPVLILYSLSRKRLPSVGPVFLPVMIYLGICVYSSLLTWRGQDAIISIVQMSLYFLIAISVFACLVERPEEMRVALYGLVITCVLLTFVAVATSYTFMGMNKNGIGGSLACAVLVGVELWLSDTSRKRRRWLAFALFILTIGLLISLSRGAWLGTLLGLASIFALRRQWITLGRLVLIMVPLVAIFWSLLPSESREYATGFGSDHYNIQARYESVDIAKSYFARSPIIGEGVGLRKEYDATNIAMMVLAETGAAGLVAFTLIYLVFFVMIKNAARQIPPSDASFSFLTVGAALMLNQISHGMVDHYWSRGPLMTAWAAAGMATGAYLLYKRTSVRARV